MEFEAKKMDARLEPPRCILCYERILMGEDYHTLEWNDLTHYFHESCYKKELGRHG
jgi:hypothetical protein